MQIMYETTPPSCWAPSYIYTSLFFNWLIFFHPLVKDEETEKLEAQLQELWWSSRGRRITKDTDWLTHCSFSPFYNKLLLLYCYCEMVQRLFMSLDCKFYRAARLDAAAVLLFPTHDSLWLCQVSVCQIFFFSFFFSKKHFSPQPPQVSRSVHLHY